MTLESVQFEIEKLNNEIDFWESRREKMLSIVYPKATRFDSIKVDGGKREDKFFKYIEFEDKYKINDTLKYLYERLENLKKWKDNELKLLKQFGKTVEELVFLKELEFTTDKKGLKRRLTWSEISEKMGYSERNLQYIYSEYKTNKAKNI